MSRAGQQAKASVGRVDTRVERWVGEHRGTRRGLQIWDVGSRAGDLLPIALLLWEARKPRGWRAGVIVFAQTIIVNFLIKRMVNRPRPRPHGSTSSFPSGHTATATAIAVGLGGQNPIHTAAIVSGAALTGVSRIGKGVHWLSDVVAGAVIGACVGLIVRKLQEV